MNITILGAGSWGTALALSLAPRHAVLLWGRDAVEISQIERSRHHQGFDLPPELALSSDFDHAVAHAANEDDLLIVATSVSGLRPVSRRLESCTISNLVWLCKGLEQDTMLLPHQVVEQELGTLLPCGVLSGPSFAQEVAYGLPCALTFASRYPELSELVLQAVHGPMMRVYSSDDLIGVELGAAVKNILAIATGIVDGLGLGLNARAALITRGLAEMSRLGQAMGGRLETFMGLAGMGDLILTCTGDLSRNRRVGLALAEGQQLAEIVSELGHVAEGVRCAQAVQALSRQLNVEMPITNAVADVLFKGHSLDNIVTSLLNRDAKAELN